MIHPVAVNPIFEEIYLMITHIIRIALCACMEFYRSELEDRSVIIQGERYLFEEVILSDASDHGDDLIAHRCHLFIDNDLAGIDEVLLSIIRVDLKSSAAGRRGIEVIVADIQYAHPYNHAGLLWHDTHTCTPHPPLHARGLIKRLKWMLQSMDVRKRREWLARMAEQPSSHPASPRISKTAALAVTLAMKSA